MESIVFEPDALRRTTAAIFGAAGTPSDLAELVAGSLIDANLAGHDSHGILRVPEYLDRIRGGAIRPAERPRVQIDRSTGVLVSGEWGFGQVAGLFAIDLAIHRAREHGISVAGIVRCNHLGRMGSYMEQAAAAGCVGLGWVGGLGGAHLAVPFGGARPVYGTNPFTAGFPINGADLVIVDFATTAIAGGKALVALANGEQLPPGSIVDRAGRPTTNPADFIDGGALLPFGGHKGYALAVLGELLGQALTGADAYVEDRAGGAAFRRSGAVFVVIDAGLFRPFEAVGAAARQTIERIRAVPPAPGVRRVLIPGDPESLARRQRLATGIPLPADTWRSIVDAAALVGLGPEELPIPGHGEIG